MAIHVVRGSIVDRHVANNMAYLQHAVTGYGYRMWRGLLWAVILWLFGMWVFGAADEQGVMINSTDQAASETHFSAGWYSFVLMPVAEVGAENAWRPDEAKEVVLMEQHLSGTALVNSFDSSRLRMVAHHRQRCRSYERNSTGRVTGTRTAELDEEATRGIPGAPTARSLALRLTVVPHRTDRDRSAWSLRRGEARDPANALVRPRQSTPASSTEPADLPTGRIMGFVAELLGQLSIQRPPATPS